LYIIFNFKMSETANPCGTNFEQQLWCAHKIEATTDEMETDSCNYHLMKDLSGTCRGIVNLLGIVTVRLAEVRLAGGAAAYVTVTHAAQEKSESQSEIETVFVVPTLLDGSFCIKNIHAAMQRLKN
jgi:hypothetical protein